MKERKKKIKRIREEENQGKQKKGERIRGLIVKQ